MQNGQYWGLIATLMFGLAACSSAPEKEAGFEVGEGGQPIEQILPDSRTSKTVLALLDTARAAAKAGQLHTAESQLERAVRIEPRNAVLWHYMAKLRLHQERMSEAAGLAAKSNSLAGKNQQLQADNWRIIAHARHQQGDLAGAEKAQKKVQQLTQ
jgi:Tfp pilus assembly protein PilF